MTTFGDQVFQYGGVPISGQIPFVRGEAKTYFVDGQSGSDGNSGLKPSEALATIAAAVTKVNSAIDWSGSPWATGDVIAVAPGVYAENLTSLPYGGAVIGLGDAFDLNGQRGVTIKPASGSPVDCTSIINCRLQNLCFESPDTSVVFQADNLNRNIIQDCVFSGLPGASPTTVKGLETVLDMTGNWIKGCVFQVVRNGIYIVVDNGSSKQASGNIIEDCYIRGADQTGVYLDANSVPSYTVLNRCNIGDKGTTLALGLDDNTDIVSCFNCNFVATANDPATGGGGGAYNNCYLNGALIT